MFMIPSWSRLSGTRICLPWQVRPKNVVCRSREQPWHHFLIWFRQSKWNRLWISRISASDNVQIKSSAGEIYPPSLQNQIHVFSLSLSAGDVSNAKAEVKKTTLLKEIFLLTPDRAPGKGKLVIKVGSPTWNLWELGTCPACTY